MLSHRFGEIVIVARFATLLLALAIFGCAPSIDRVAPTNRFCENDYFLIDAQFEAGNFDACQVMEDGGFSITVLPEDSPPINNSPWYAFRVSPKRAGEVTVNLQIVDGDARYWPKISTDGRLWRPLDTSDVTRSEARDSFQFRLDVGESTLWVAAQELLTTAWYDSWIQELAAHDDIATRLLGRSVEGRPIHVAVTANRPEVVVLLGRQHPPEVTGAMAMHAFVDTVLGDSALAREFRDRFAIIIVPLMNPDGVVHGHWRHNVNGVDLNRDWGPFTQPETRSILPVLDTLDELGSNIRLMLDFHSTRSNLFYTQPVEESELAGNFASIWLSRAQQRLPNHEFTHDANETSEQANSKNYFFRRYGIPAITYELGDETDRNEIVRASPVFAQEMMRLLLEYPPQ